MKYLLPRQDLGQNFDDAIAVTPPADQRRGLLEDLMWENEIQQRTTTVVTTSFNIFAASLVIASILIDAKRASRRATAHGLKPENTLIPKIHPVDTFPFIASIATFAQGAIFLGVEGSGLRGFEFQNCRAISQLTWPAIWIVAYTLLVFSIEVAFRGFQKIRFCPRGKFSVSLCWSIVVVLLIATWIPSQFRRDPRDSCAATLLAMATPWAATGLSLNIWILFFYLLTGFLILYQLARSPDVDLNERIAASRTVCYLGIGVILMTVVLPFWARLVSRASVSAVAQAATIALNIFGLLNGLLYVILRMNSPDMILRQSLGTSDQERVRRPFGSPNLDVDKQFTSPVGLSWDANAYNYPVSFEEKRSLQAHADIIKSPDLVAVAQGEPPNAFPPPSYKTPEQSFGGDSLPHWPPSYYNAPALTAEDQQPVSPLSMPPQPLYPKSVSQQHSRGISNIFPHHLEAAPTPPSHTPQTGTPAIPAPPSPAPLPTGPRRALSNISSATIHIGMRLSSCDLSANLIDGINTAVTYPPRAQHSHFAHRKNQFNMFQQTIDGVLQPLGRNAQVTVQAPGVIPHNNSPSIPHIDQGPHPSEPIPYSPPNPPQDLLSPASKVSSSRRLRDWRMKSLPPVPVSPAVMNKSPNPRMSFPEPWTPSLPNGQARTPHGPTALSLALKEDGEWPLQAEMLMELPDKSYDPSGERRWI